MLLLDMAVVPHVQGAVQQDTSPVLSPSPVAALLGRGTCFILLILPIPSTDLKSVSMSTATNTTLWGAGKLRGMYFKENLR